MLSALPESTGRYYDGGTMVALAVWLSENIEAAREPIWRSREDLTIEK